MLQIANQEITRVWLDSNELMTNVPKKNFKVIRYHWEIVTLPRHQYANKHSLTLIYPYLLHYIEKPVQDGENRLMTSQNIEYLQNPYLSNEE